ncbi:MAG: hypothetical protein IK139_08750, partial [Lachnospiraceae bacterium]|nr:hypothetical protein [Lachnospiraceae bacterium]
MTGIIFELANIIPLSFAASLLLFSDNKGSWLLILLPAVIPVFCVLLLHMKKRGRLVLSGTVISLAAGSLIVAGRESRQAFFEGYSWTLFVILLCAGVFVFEETALRHRKLKIVSCACLVTVLMYMLFFRIQAGRIEVAMILFYLLVTAVEETGIRWERDGAEQNRSPLRSGRSQKDSHWLSGSPLAPLFIVLIMLLLLKAPAKPYD